MRKFLILVILFGIMVSLLAFDFGTNLLPFEPKTLAVTGFILLAAYTMGEVVQKFGPPKVVGYIFAGILFGPYLPEVLEALFGWNIPKLFSKEIAAKDLALVNKLALGLIGLTAGGELLVAQLKKDARNILGVIGSQTLIVSLCVGTAVFTLAAVYPAAFAFLPQDFAQGWKSYLAMAMLLGALAVGTSPATTLAVISETRAQGPLKNLTLGLIIAKDVTTVTFYLLMLAFAAVLATGKDFELSVLVHIAEELGYAIALGALLGLAFWAYLRWVKAEIMLVTIAVVFLGNFIAEAVHAEALLLFIAAGFVVAHGDQLYEWVTTTWKARKGAIDTKPHDDHGEDHHDDHHHDVGHEMIEQLERISLPTFVVFFTIAAAKLDLTALPKYWMVVLLYIVVRAISITASTQFALKKLQAPDIIQRNLWLGMFAQGGVTLTISGFVATRGVSWGAEFSTIIMATLLVDIVAGPVLLKYGLMRSGEAASSDTPQAGEETQEDSEELSTPHVPNLLAVDFPEPNFESKNLNKALLKIRSNLLSNVQHLREELLQPRQATQRAVYDHTLSLITTHLQETHTSFIELCDQNKATKKDEKTKKQQETARRKLKHLVRKHRREVAQSIEQTLADHGFPTPPDPNEVHLKDLLLKIEDLTTEQTNTLVVAQDADLFASSVEDSAWVRSVKSLKRLIRSFGGLRTREVPLLHLVRYHLELSLPQRLIEDAKALSGQQRHAWRQILRLHAFSDEAYLHALSTLDEAPLNTPATTDEDPTEPKAAVEILRDHFEHTLSLLDADSTEHETNLSRDVLQSMERSLENVSTILRNTLAVPYNELLSASRVAGTFELSSRAYSAAKVFDASNKARQEFEHTIQQQRAFTHGSNNRVQAALHMVDVQSNVRRTLDAALTDVRGRLFQPLQSFPKTLSERITESQSILEDHLLAGANPYDLQQHINGQKERILSFHKESILAEIQEIRSSRRLDEILDALRESLRSLTNTQTISLLPAQEAEIQLLSEEDLQDLTQRSVPLQTLLHEALSREVAVRLSDADMRLHILVDRASADFTEIARIVRFNLEAAANELISYTTKDDPPAGLPSSTPLKPKLFLDSSGLVTENGIEHPRDFIIDGLTRANERANALLAHVRESRATIESLLLDETVKQLRKVLQLVLNGSYEDIQNYISHPEDQPETHREEPSSKPSAFFQALSRRWLQNPKPSDIDEFRQHLTYEDSSELPLHRQLSILDEQISTWGHEDLPHTYKRLFNPQATEVSDFFISRPEMMRNFNDAVEQWLQNRYTSITIVGEPGSGRQSFIEEVMRTRLEGMPVIRRHLTHTIQTEAELASELSSILGGPQTTDLARLRARLSHQNERVVIILEDAENLFLRSLNGMSTIQQFMHVLSETGQKILWVLTMDLHAWRYLDTMTHIRQRFTHPLILRPLTRNELEEVIISRHRVSGLGLTYNSEARGFQQVRMLFAQLQNRTNDRQKILQDIFFDQLYEISQGNPLLGIYYWLQSVQPLPEDDDILRVQPPESIAIPFLHTLDTETLMTLSNIVLHDGLTVREFAEVFRVTDAQAQTALKHLLHLRLVYVEAGSQDRYKLNRVLYLTVTETLRERNLL